MEYEWETPIMEMEALLHRIDKEKNHQEEITQIMQKIWNYPRILEQGKKAIISMLIQKEITFEEGKKMLEFIINETIKD